MVELKRVEDSLFVSLENDTDYPTVSWRVLIETQEEGCDPSYEEGRICGTEAAMVAWIREQKGQSQVVKAFVPMFGREYDLVRFMDKGLI